MPKPKSFDEQKKLQEIMRVFWEKGYSETSLSDLTNSTGLNKMSLYNTYGNKEQMFLKSLELYSVYSNQTRDLKCVPEDGLKFLKEFFKTLINEALCSSGDKGCFVMNSKLEMEKDLKDPKHQLVTKHWDNISKALSVSVATAKKNKELNAKTQTTLLSKWLLSQAFLIKQMSKFSDDKSGFKEILKQVESTIKQNQ